MSVPPGERLPAARIASHLGVMAIVAAVMGVVVAGLAIPFAGVLGIGAKSLSHTVEDLPANLRTQPLAQQTQIVDQSGTTIATLYDQNRINVPLSQISRKMVKSIVAIEDYRYYQHGALDLKGTLRALVTNQASGGSVQGGSSITQQMVKMTLVDQAKTAKQRKAATADTYARKLTELRYAIAFEQNYSKDWILERYLNIAYYGDGAYGVQAAARHYFDTNAKDLTLLQGATLAGLVKNPSGYDPITNPDRGIQRRNVVLDRLAQLHVIKQHRADLLKKQPLGLHPVATPNGCVNSSAPFFCDYVVNYLEQDPALGKTVDARKKLLYTGGLTIHTTISLPDQRAADTSVHNHVLPDRPGDRGPGDGRAGHRRREGHRPVAPDGSRHEGRPDLPQLRRPPEVRRLQRLPARVDVQGVRARGGDPAGHPAVPDDPVADAGPHPDERVPRLRGQALRRAPTPGRRTARPSAASR